MADESIWRELETTWDGLPVARETPYGASVLVWRRGGREPEWLLLHRKHHGPGYAGDWAWTPPSGARLPGEHVDACARRELLEETGLTVEPIPTPLGPDEWALYVAEVPADATVRLDPEHDRYTWAGTPEAVRICLPGFVGHGFALAAEWLAASAPPRTRHA